MARTLVPALLGLALLGGLARSGGGDRADEARALVRPGDPRVAAAAPLPGGLDPEHAIAARAARDRRFAAGLALFDRAFHRSEGVGAPFMNADSCRACHEDPVIGGAGALELNVSRMGHDAGGSIPFEDVEGGQILSKLQPPWIPGREEYMPGLATVFEQRQTPALFGVGLIDEIPGEVLLAGEDPDDDDGDGVRGVARMVPVPGGLEVGRYGWKAQIPRIEDFVRDALGAELGLTTADDGRGFAVVADDDASPEPEVAEKDVALLTHFLERLPAPPRAGSTDPAVALGESLFGAVGCATCHVPSLPAPNGPVPLYSDLLLHDVMPEDFRGMAEEGAGVGLYRTPPLWGVRDTAPYMHDGRAADLEAAIAAHESEGEASRLAFEALEPAEREALLLFLADL